jgi:hypothetical protein
LDKFPKGFRFGCFSRAPNTSRLNFHHSNPARNVSATKQKHTNTQTRNTKSQNHKSKTLHKIQNTKYLILDTAPIKHPMSSTRLTDRQTNRQNGIRTDKQTACLFIFNSVPDEPAEVSMCCGLLLFLSYCCFVCLFRLFLPSLANQPTLQCVVARRSARGAFQSAAPSRGTKRAEPELEN